MPLWVVCFRYSSLQHRKMISKIFLLSVVALQLVHAVNMKATTSVPAAGDEPNYKDYAKVARYLVHKSGMHCVAIDVTSSVRVMSIFASQITHRWAHFRFWMVSKAIQWWALCRWPTVFAAPIQPVTSTSICCISTTSHTIWRPTTNWRHYSRTIRICRAQSGDWIQWSPPAVVSWSPVTLRR